MCTIMYMTHRIDGVLIYIEYRYAYTITHLNKYGILKNAFDDFKYKGGEIWL